MSAPPEKPYSQAPLVLVLTAGMGAGHDRVGRELANRLDVYGTRTELVDAGELLPRGWGVALTRSYRLMATRAQWLYELTFRAQMDRRRLRTSKRAHTGPSLGPLGPAAYRRLGALVRDRRPALVVSTFHLCSQITGQMRERQRLKVPVVSLVLDFHVHRMWPHPGVDAHLLLHEVQAGQVCSQGGRSPVVCGPVVRPAFAGAGTWCKAEARRSLGLSYEDRVVLIVAGSWGVGRVERTVDAVLAATGFVPLVVAGQNQALRRSLEQRCEGVTGAQIFGWVDDMERLVAASDVVVENAGGLSAMEAMALGTPVVSYAPIAGHGRANAQKMAQAGVSVFARTSQQLVDYLELLCSDSPLRANLVEAGHAMFRDDPARLIAAWAKAGRVYPEIEASGSKGSHRLGHERSTMASVL